MKITVLDGHAANPGDLSWEKFKDFADLTVYDRTRPEDTVARIGTSDGIFLNKVLITKEVLDLCPNLKYIGILATGYNVVDLKACSERNIVVTNIPAYSTESVAQHVFSLILNFTNLVQLHNDSVKNGDWIKSPDFCYWKKPLSQLCEKTIGIFGFGSIGRKTAEIARAFGMNVQICVHNTNSFTGTEKSVSFSELLSSSDIITLHAPLTEETSKIINRKTLSLVKPEAIIINTARGGLVDENDIAQALNENKLGGYGTDVLSSEPMSQSCPLLHAKNCVITPHIAWAPKETREKLFEIALENLKAFLSGNPINQVNK